MNHGNVCIHLEPEIRRTASAAPLFSRKVIQMRTSNSFPVLIFIVITGAGAVLGFGLNAAGQEHLAFIVFGIALFVGAVTSSAIRVADQWSKAVVLRLGKFRALKG